MDGGPKTANYFGLLPRLHVDQAATLCVGACPDWKYPRYRALLETQSVVRSTEAQVAED